MYYLYIGMIDSIDYIIDHVMTQSPGPFPSMVGELKILTL